MRTVVVSDQHLSEGPFILQPEPVSFFERVRLWLLSEHPRSILVANPIEDFPHDEEFAAFVDRLREESASFDRTRLVLNGDVFDFFAVRSNGVFKESEIVFERDSVAKLAAILDGHPLYVDALERFLADARHELVVVPGNHDQELIWPGVQQLLAERVSGGNAERAARIRFVQEDERERGAFRLVEDGVIIDHGNNAKPDSSFPPECIRTPRFKGGHGTPYMEMNFGAGWALLVNQMKLMHELIGRNHPAQGMDVWKERALHGWGWARRIARLFLAKFCSILFFFWRRGWLQRIIMTSHVIVTTAAPKEEAQAEEKYLKRLRSRFKDAVVIVTGHTHAPGRRTVQLDDGSKRSITSVNSGTWIRMIRLVWMEFPSTWKRFRWLEFHIRAFAHFVRTGKISYARRAAEIVGYLGVLAVIAVFVTVNFPGKENILLWNVSLSDFRLPAGVAFFFIALAGLIRFFAVQPDKEPFRKLTFADVSYVRTEMLDAQGKVIATEAGEYRADCMEWLPERNEVRECV